jgi:hypothetical protein
MRKDTLSEESHVSTGLWTAPDKHGRFLADTPSATALADSILRRLKPGSLSQQSAPFLRGPVNLVEGPFADCVL